MRRRRTALGAVLLAVAATACSQGAAKPNTAATADESGPLVVYSGRNEKLIGSLIAEFEKTGVDVEVRYGDSAELAAQILEEGGNRRADVFFSQDAGALGALAREGRLEQLPAAATAAVAPKFRAEDGTWVGVSGRARVVAYNPAKVPAAELPTSVFELVDPKWKGRVGIPPTNASFQSFVTAMRVTAGEAKTKAWLTALKANGARTYEKNGLVLDAVDKGEVHVGLINHYYLYEKIAEVGEGKVSVRNHFLGGGDPGALVNVAGAGIVQGTKRRQAAEKFVAFLLSQTGQRYFVDKTAEYPVVAGLEPRAGLPKLADIDGPDIDLADLASLKETLTLLQEVGLT